MNQRREEWRPISNYEGLYEISDRGRVKSKPRRGTRKAGSGFLSPWRGRNNYPYVTLSNGQGQKLARRLNRLVAEAFLGLELGAVEIQVDHEDGDHWNNWASNLSLVDPLGNVTRAIDRGHHNVAVLDETTVRTIRALHDVERLSTREIIEALDLAVLPSAVRQVALRISWAWVEDIEACTCFPACEAPRSGSRILESCAG